MLAVVWRVPVDEIKDYYAYTDDVETEGAIARRQAVFADQIFAHSPIGQQILKLRQEKDRLLDTVWLATSLAAIKTLWEKVGQLLGDELTSLEREALTIAPDASESAS